MTPRPPRVALALALLSPLVAHASDPAAASPAPDVPVGPYVFHMPADTDPQRDELGCGVRLGFERTESNALGQPTGLYGRVERTGADQALVTTFRGSEDTVYGKGEKTPATVSVTRNPEGCELSMSLGTAEPYKLGTLTWGKPPTFTARDVVEQTPVFVYRTSFDSPFPAASVMANFDRLAHPGCGDVGYGVSRTIPRALRSRETLYCAKTENGVAPFQVSCVPYREGSKCSVLTILPASREGSTWDTRTHGTAFRTAIQAIVSD